MHDWVTYAIAIGILLAIIGFGYLAWRVLSYWWSEIFVPWWNRRVLHGRVPILSIGSRLIIDVNQIGDDIFIIPIRYVILNNVLLLADITLVGRSLMDPSNRQMNDALGGITLFSMAMVFLGMWTLVIDYRRERLLSTLRPLGLRGVAIFFITYSTASILAFSGLTALLIARGVLDPHAGSMPYPARWVAFYTWHATDAIPVLPIIDTLHWKDPVSYHSLGIGIMIIGFKLLFIIPTLTALVGYLKHRVGGLSEASILRVLRFYGIAIALTIGVFGAFSMALPSRDWLTPITQNDSAHQWFVFYIWEAFNVVPGLNATQALQWKQPISYADWRVGSLVLAFKLTFVVLALVAAKRYLTVSAETDVAVQKPVVGRKKHRTPGKEDRAGLREPELSPDLTALDLDGGASDPSVSALTVDDET